LAISIDGFASLLTFAPRFSLLQAGLYLNPDFIDARNNLAKVIALHQKAKGLPGGLFN
jgi:hypothetical protein